MPAPHRIAAAVFCLAAASAIQAQQRQVQQVPNAVPSAAARSAQSAPRPAGLSPVFPAGLGSGSGAAVSRDPIAASTTPIRPAGSVLPSAAGAGIATDAPPLEAAATVTDLQFGGAVLSTAVPATAVMGAGAGATVRGPARAAGGAGGFSAVDTARSFYFADGNHDGELSRSEFNRLSIATLTFEEMDRNFDQVISRFEFDDSVR